MINKTNPDTRVALTELLELVQRYAANVGISGSSLRNQGAKGVVGSARSFLVGLNLNPLREMVPAEYTEWLEAVTYELQSSLPEGARKWGTARKAINIFTCQAFLNKELSAAYDLNRFGDVMETPLDSMATDELRKRAGRAKLPRWLGIGKLTPEVSRKYQGFASVVAKRYGIPRANLDLLLWRPIATGNHS